MVLDDRTVAYIDLAGSNAETIAHLRENGRITLMWCAFDGPPTIVRIHGRAEPVFRDDPRWVGLAARFDGLDLSAHGPRAIILVHATLVRDTCGYTVPLMTYDRERDLHAKRFTREDDASLSEYFTKKEHIASSLDGLPGSAPPAPTHPGSPLAPSRSAVPRSVDWSINRCGVCSAGTPPRGRSRSLGIELFATKGVDVMTSTGTGSDRRVDQSSSKRVGPRRGRVTRWAAGAVLGATLAVAGVAAAAPAQAVSLPGRCDLNSGVWTCLP